MKLVKSEEILQPFVSNIVMLGRYPLLLCHKKVRMTYSYLDDIRLVGCREQNQAGRYKGIEKKFFKHKNPHNIFIYIPFFHFTKNIFTHEWLDENTRYVSLILLYEKWIVAE